MNLHRLFALNGLPSPLFERFFKRALAPWPMLALLGVFAVAQTIGVVHAQVHLFHEHSETCDLFEGLAHPAAKLDSLHFSLVKPAPFVPLAQPFYCVHQPRAFCLFTPRAPPPF
ncbi:hypothetical protein [Thiomicrorhabdus aquaedulcis]|uniref:hypothetical protein n=1 Tax=Thiomicrorhabdus aquaedulcis TaxID=2211106 RepID=UPI000FD70ABC|nr:hypothetical protein [Thiomicrorhabdus aquaedulcis]